MANLGLVLGVDIGGTNTAMGLVDREGCCLASASMPTQGDQPAAVFFQRLHVRAQALLDSLGTGVELLAIGIGAPNANYLKCTIENPPNLSWEFVDIQAELAPYFDIPVAATNDANAAALGELHFGAARGLRDFIVITLGTGLGSGIVVNGELLYGSTGLAGELGHVIAEEDGRLCGCGRRGCLETYASATGLLRTVSDLLDCRDSASELHAVPRTELTARRVFEAAQRGDELALEAFEFTGTMLGRKLADAVAFSSPEAIILFGGLAGAGPVLFDPTRKALEDNLFRVFKGTVKLLPSGIQGGHAAILGASALGWDKLGKLSQHVEHR
ncbi:MAG: ROK family protein [Holophaga sp.]|nr:ROK family protein [Holophaga sp.]